MRETSVSPVTSIDFNTQELERTFASLLEDSIDGILSDVEVLSILTRAIKQKVPDARLQDILLRILRSVPAERILKSACLVRRRGISMDHQVAMPPVVESFSIEELKRKGRRRGARVS